MRNQKVFDMVALAMLMAIIFIMAFVPNFGYIQIGLLSITIMQIPVIIAAIYFGRRIGVLAGAVFGITSFIVAYIRVIPTPVNFDYLFRDPAISILPRMLFPFLTVLLYEGLGKWLKNDSLKILIASIGGALIHSILVLGLLFFLLVDVNNMKEAGIIIQNPNYPTQIFVMLAGVFVSSSLLEAAFSGIVATPITKAMKIAFSRVKTSDKKLVIEDNPDDVSKE